MIRFIRNIFNKIHTYTCYFSTVSAESTNIRRFLLNDQIDVSKLNFSEIKNLSDQVLEGLKNKRLERTLVVKFSNIVSDYIQRDTENGRKLTLEDYFSLLEYNYLTHSDKYLSVLTSNITCLLDEKYKESEKLPEQELDKLVSLLTRLNKLGVYNNQLFNFMSNYVKLLNDELLSKFSNLSQKYGLRTKHILDMCYEECLKRVDDMDINLTLNMLRSYTFFSFEYREIFLKTIPKLSENVDSFSNDDVIMFLNVAKTLSQFPELVQFRDLILSKMNENLESQPNTHLIRCVGELYRGSRSRSGKTFVSNVLDKIDEDDFRLVSVSNLVNVMHTINFYKMKLTYLTDILTILSMRMNEIVSNRNLGLWSEIFSVLLETGWFSLPFMQSAIKHIISEPQVLCRVSTYQIVRVLQTFYKLRLYHKESYQTLLDSIERGFDMLVPKFNMISETILAAADANIEHQTLFTKSLEFFYSRIRHLNLLELDDDLITVMNKNYIWPRNVITSAWSMAVMDLHKRDGFKTLLELIVHRKFVEQDFDMNTILMCLETAEACMVDEVNMELAQEISDLFGDKMRFKEINMEEEVEYETLRDNKLSFNESQNIHFHKGRSRATKHIQSILENINKKDILLKVSPHYNSPYIIDICFPKENKKGIVLFSGRELLRNHVDSTWSVINTGSSKLKLKILSKQNWNVCGISSTIIQVAQVSCSQWSVLNTGMERKEFVKKLLTELSISY